MKSLSPVSFWGLAISRSWKLGPREQTSGSKNHDELMQQYPCRLIIVFTFETTVSTIIVKYTDINWSFIKT